MRMFQVFPALIVLLLGGCVGSGGWKTDYSDTITRDIARNWGYGKVLVVVPDHLTVSEENSFAPDADIVWQEDPPGNRYLQVADVIHAGADRAAKRLNRGAPVTITLKVLEFHALTRRARYNAPSGVHNITFMAQVYDGRTGEKLTPPDVIRADLKALTGDEALRAEQRGVTQKDRIAAHIEQVIAGWLGFDPDPRGSFGGFGR